MYKQTRLFLSILFLLPFILTIHSSCQKTDTNNSDNNEYSKCEIPKTGVWEKFEGFNSQNSPVTAMVYDEVRNILYVSGTYVVQGGTGIGVSKWDGQTWEVIPGIRGRNIDNLNLDKNGNLYVSGFLLNDNTNGLEDSPLYKWDGQEWSTIGGWITSSERTYDVAFDSQDNLYVVGSFSYDFDGVFSNKIMKWNGQNWIPVSNDNYSGQSLKSILIDENDHIYVGGNFSKIGSLETRSIAKLVENKWLSLNEGILGSINDMVFDEIGNIIVAGNLNNSNGKELNNIARWDGNSWSSFGEGFNYPTKRVLVCGNNIITSGSFTTAGNVNTNFMARWDGEKWDDLNSDFEHEIEAMALGKNGTIYAGGNNLYDDFSSGVNLVVRN